MKIKKLYKYTCLIFLIPIITMTVLANEPPATPDIIGPSSGKAGTEYPYAFCSSDPEGGEIYYCNDWGEGSGSVCIGPFPSEVCANIPYTWTVQGTYVIKATAKDSLGAESPESTKSVEMPRSIITHNMFIQRFVINHPIIHLILQKLIKGF